MTEEYSNTNSQNNFSNNYNQENIMPEEINLKTTKTLGETLENREFTNDEKIVLLHFFTNIDKNIYAATDAMPNTLWALLEGGYSRAQESMRMRFLQIFTDMQKDLEKGKIHSEEVVSIKDFAEKIQHGDSLNLSFFLSKAEKFMRKWAVQYGHDSLKDSDVLRFAIENVTQLATGPIEEARLGAYQEKSTRYVPFSRDHLIVPTDLKEYESEIREWNNLLITSYENAKITVSEFIKNRLDSSSFKTEAAFNRTVNAKTFDIIRYFLPATILTSLGVVWPTREAERHISRLMTDEKEEIRAIGYALLEEGKKISPGLLNHVAVNEFQQKRSRELSKILNSLKIPKAPATIDRKEDALNLISIDPDSEAKIAAAILFEHNQEAHSFNHYFNLCKQIPLIVEPIITAYLKDRGNFDDLPIATELGSMLFEVTMDYGGYRDLKRHRRNLLLTAPFTTELGYEYPEYVAEEPALQEVKDTINYCSKQTEILYHKIKKVKPHLAPYIVMFIHKQQYIWQMDPRQLAYVAELRGTPAGHWSYRDIAQRMFTAIKPTLPTLSKFIRVDMTLGEEGRKKQEEKTVEKLKALGGDLQKLS
ncbi:hypothetical protein CL619_00360 [archaeon]|nr:hypothetical protein [archaeon]|tara:strand:+ start:4048 stop:5820 length:1773 start_codon:yes stop_codon:yes gene_type:complete